MSTTRGRMGGSAEQAIAIFAKPPIPGHTKSRLASTTGREFAANLSSAMLADILHEASGVDAQTILFHPPGYGADDFSNIGNLPDRLMEQEGDDLGIRMLNCLRRLLDVDGFSRVVIIGSDCISHSRESLTDAFSRLHAHQVVIQPADDGGYVLIGATRAIAQVFSGVEWGTDTVWETTRRRLEGIDHLVMPVSFDVDDIDDLERLKEFCQYNPRPHTQAVLGTYRVPK